MAGQQTLNLYVLVRLQCPQPVKKRGEVIFSSFLYAHWAGDISGKIGAHLALMGRNE